MKGLTRAISIAFVLAITCAGSSAQLAEKVLIVINDNSSLSREIGEYYARRRGIPAGNVCRIRSATDETIARPDYNRQVAGPIAACLRKANLVESVLYLVTTAGVPLRIAHISGDGMGADNASVDSELTLLYADIRGNRAHPIAGSLPNPFFGKVDAKFSHPQFPMYLVTRLAAYDFDGVKGLVDRALEAANRGKFVIDLRGGLDPSGGDGWLKRAAALLPAERTVLETSGKVLYDQTGVIGYASWGSNDPNRHRRFIGFHWLPGAIRTEFVSSDGRTFAKPPDNWNISDWKSPKLWFAGSPQSMSADYILEGVTGASGHVYEPFLAMTPHPEFLLGRRLQDSSRVIETFHRRSAFRPRDRDGSAISCALATTPGDPRRPIAAPGSRP
jgi:uncharacterized protein (TIGR03790 family)